MSGDLSNWSFRRSLRTSLGNVRYVLRFPGYVRNWLRIWNKYDLAAFIQSGVIPFVCEFRLGDNFLLSAFAGEYCKTYGLQGVVVLAPPNQVGLLQRFPGVKGFLSSIPSSDKIIFLTSREEKYKEKTIRFLKDNGLRFDYIIFDLPPGERILINDIKPGGLKTAICINVKRNSEWNVHFEVDENL